LGEDPAASGGEDIWGGAASAKTFATELSPALRRNDKNVTALHREIGNRRRGWTNLSEALVGSDKSVVVARAVTGGARRLLVKNRAKRLHSNGIS
jgi:hypothetical protein